jgi:transposase
MEEARQECKRGQKRVNAYPLEFRQMIVDLHLEKKRSYRQIREEYGLGNKVVRVWCKWYRENGIAKSIKKWGVREEEEGKKKGSEKEEIKRLKKEVEELRMENDILKKVHELLSEESLRR